MMMMVTMMACRHIPTMTKSHHGGNMSVMIKVGMCQCQNPTIHDKVQLGPVGSGKLFNMPPVLRHNISAKLGPSDRTQQKNLNFLVIIYSMFSTQPQHMARFIQFRAITPSILNMPFHVCHQLACPNGCIVTLVAFIWLFAAVCFQMFPQIA